MTEAGEILDRAKETLAETEAYEGIMLQLAAMVERIQSRDSAGEPEPEESEG